MQLAEEGGRRIMEIYDGPREDWNLSFKDDDSPLTAADLACNAVIMEGLRRLAPLVPVLSEENGTPPSYDTRRQWPSLFVVDPLDGTKDFVKRTGEFTVNIALVTRGEDGRYAPVLGVVHVPATSTSFWAERGHGAFMKDSQGVRPVRASDPPIDQEGLRVVSSASHPDGLTKVLMDEAFRNPVSEQFGSSLKLTMVAAGLADCYPRLSPTCEWDTAAADAVVREAGAHVIQAGDEATWREAVRRGEPLEYNKPDLLNPWFVVCPTRIKEGLAAIL